MSHDDNVTIDNDSIRKKLDLHLPKSDWKQYTTLAQDISFLKRMNRQHQRDNQILENHLKRLEIRRRQKQIIQEAAQQQLNEIQNDIRQMTDVWQSLEEMRDKNLQSHNVLQSGVSAAADASAAASAAIVVVVPLKDNEAILTLQGWIDMRLQSNKNTRHLSRYLRLQNNNPRYPYPLNDPRSTLKEIDMYWSRYALENQYYGLIQGKQTKLELLVREMSMKRSHHPHQQAEHPNDKMIIDWFKSCSVSLSIFFDYLILETKIHRYKETMESGLLARYLDAFPRIRWLTFKQWDKYWNSLYDRKSLWATIFERAHRNGVSIVFLWKLIKPSILQIRDEKDNARRSTWMYLFRECHKYGGYKSIPSDCGTDIAVQIFQVISSSSSSSSSPSSFSSKLSLQETDFAHQMMSRMMSTSPL
jgi:hypothetical protein